MDRIEYLADATVRRGCGFMLLAVLTVMWSLSYDLLLSLKTGAILMTLHCAALGLFAYNAPRRNHKSTELWTQFNRGADLPANYPPAQLLEVLRKTYLRYAELSGMLAVGLAFGAAVVWIVRGVV